MSELNRNIEVIIPGKLAAVKFSHIPFIAGLGVFPHRRGRYHQGQQTGGQLLGRVPAKFIQVSALELGQVVPEPFHPQERAQFRL